MRLKTGVFNFITMLAVWSMLTLSSPFVASSYSASTSVDGPAVPVIQYFAGEIIIYYKDGTTITLRTGDNAPVLQPGAVIYVKSGSLALNINDDIANFEAGETISITLDQNGNWTASSSTTESSLASNTSLANTQDSNSESEIVIEEGEEEEVEEETPVEISPS